MWSVSYVHDGPKAKEIALSTESVQPPHEESRKKLIAKLEIQKDDIQSVLPISKVRCTPPRARISLKFLFNSHFFFSTYTELGADEHGRPHGTTSIASYESVHCHTGRKGCRRDSSELLSC